MKIKNGIIIDGKIYIGIKIKDNPSDDELEMSCSDCSLREKCFALKKANDIFCNSLFNNPFISFKEVEGEIVLINKPKKERTEATPAGDPE